MSVFEKEEREREEERKFELTFVVIRKVVDDGFG
jgi:hypothetical protein